MRPPFPSKNAFTKVDLDKEISFDLRVTCHQPYQFTNNAHVWVMEADDSILGFDRDDVILNVKLLGTPVGKGGRYEESILTIKFGPLSDNLFGKHAEVYLKFTDVCQQGHTERFGNIFQKDFDLTPKF
uniref:Uncharacterized protein n=1 Tax=Panagrolaimus sp. JU765 TaxID=591449 RepID=A0AC34Q8G2_9BILA